MSEATKLDLSEGGKHVRTKFGAAVRVYSTDGGGKYPLHGAIWRVANQEWGPETWTLDGKYHDDGTASTDDLVPYVPEPQKPRTHKVVLNVFDVPAGWHFTESAVVTVYGKPQKMIASVPFEFTEGEFAFAKAEPAPSEPSQSGMVTWQFEAPDDTNPMVLVPSGEVRLVNEGEYFVLPNGKVGTAAYDFKSDKYQILRRVEPSRVEVVNV